MTLRALALALCLFAISGCFRTTVRAGHAPADPPEAWDRRWHSGWVVGIIEASGPHDLARICPGGWAQIETETDPSQALVTLLTIGIYAPQSVTVICRTKAAPDRARPPPYEPF